MSVILKNQHALRHFVSHLPYFKDKMFLDIDGVVFPLTPDKAFELFEKNKACVCLEGSLVFSSDDFDMSAHSAVDHLTTLINGSDVLDGVMVDIDGNECTITSDDAIMLLQDGYGFDPASRKLFSRNPVVLRPRLSPEQEQDILKELAHLALVKGTTSADSRVIQSHAFKIACTLNLPLKTGGDAINILLES